MTQENKKPVTPEFRVSFPVIINPDDKGKYRLVMLFPKGIDVVPAKGPAQQLYQKMVHEATAAVKVKWGDDEKKWPRGLEWPFKDQGDKLDTNGNMRDGYEAGAICVSVSSKNRPQCVNAAKENIDPADIYAGCYARASYHAYAWEYKNEKGVIMKRGVSLGLGNLQKTRDGEPFSSRSLAEDDFEALESFDPAAF